MNVFLQITRGIVFIQKKNKIPKTKRMAEFERHSDARQIEIVCCINLSIETT